MIAELFDFSAKLQCQKRFVNSRTTGLTSYKKGDYIYILVKLPDMLSKCEFGKLDIGN